MSATKTKRLPRGLKKKLEASLSDLTPRQAGRLWLIYLHEAQKKNFIPFNQYPPTKELFTAWDKRLEEARKKSPADYNRQAALFNGFLFLTNLAREANGLAVGDSWRALFKVSSSYNLVFDLLQKDWVSQVARLATSQLSEEMPRPASREEYDRVIQLAQSDDLVELEDGEVIDFLFVEDWVDAQGFKYIDRADCIETLKKERPEEWKTVFGKEFSEGPENLATNAPKSEEAIRRLYAEVAGDRLLEEFGGRSDWVDDWVKEEFYFKPDEGLRFTLDDYDAKIEATSAKLVDMVKTGDLEGGQAVSLDRVWGLVLIKNGKIPAWAALRSVWGRWLYDHDHFLRITPDPDPTTLNGIQKVYNAEGDVDVAALVALARDFFEDCQAKPWAEGLGDAGQIGFVALARFLCEEEEPIMPYTALNLGDVDFEAFKVHEADAVFGDPTWAATVRSLKSKAADFGVEPEIFHSDYLLDRYYPTDDAERIRRTISLAFNLLDNLKVSHREFTYKRGKKKTAKDYFGVEFVTPLEEAVKFLSDAFEVVATVKRSYQLLSDQYFGGMSLLFQEVTDRLEDAEKLLAVAEKGLQDWLKRIETLWPDDDEIDLSSLRLVKPEADEQEAREFAALLIRTARRDTEGGQNIDIDLGPEGDQPVAWQLPLNKLEPATIDATIDDEGSEEE